MTDGRDPNNGQFLEGNEIAKVGKRLPTKKKVFDQLLDYIGKEMANKLGQAMPKLPEGMREAEYLAMRKWAQITFGAGDDKLSLEGIRMLWDRRFPKLSSVEIEDMTPKDRVRVPAQIVDEVVEQVLDRELKKLDTDEKNNVADLSP